MNQEITLMVYALPLQRRWIICEHSRIAHDSGDLFLRADLSCYTPPSACPAESGLHLVRATAATSKERWGGCRLAIESHAKLCGSIEEFLATESTEKER